MTATNYSRDNHTHSFLYSLAVSNRLCDKFHVLVTYLTISKVSNHKQIPILLNLFNYAKFHTIKQVPILLNLFNYILSSKP